MSATDERKFLTARTEFQNVFGDLAKGKHNWQLAAFGLLGLLGIVLVAFVQLALTSRITPYVVEVDELGRAVAFGPAEKLEPTDQRIIIAQLATFVTNVRTVVPSVDAQRDLIKRAYAFVTDRGAGFLNEYFSEPSNDPTILGSRMTRLVEVTSIISVPGSGDSTNAKNGTWKVQWTETEIPIIGGGTTQKAAWEGYLTVRIIPPKRADVIELNPLGVYITAITWSQIASSHNTPDAVERVSPAPLAYPSPNVGTQSGDTIQ